LSRRVIREFLRRYDGAPIPKDNIAENVLVEMGVPQARAAEVLRVILDDAESVGFLQAIKDRKYVDLGKMKAPAPAEEETKSEEQDAEETLPDSSGSASRPTPTPVRIVTPPA